MVASSHLSICCLHCYGIFIHPPTALPSRLWWHPAIVSLRVHRYAIGTLFIFPFSRFFLFLLFVRMFCVSFLARGSMLSALYAIANPSVCPSHGWISRKRLKLGLCSCHHTVAPSLCFLWYKFHPEILRGSPWAGASNKVGLGKRAIFVVRTLSLGGCTSYSLYRCFGVWVQNYSPGGGTVARSRRRYLRFLVIAAVVAK